MASAGHPAPVSGRTIPRSPFPSLPRIPSSRSTREGSDYGRARAAGWIRTSRTHPVMSASLRACGVLSRGGWSSALKAQEPNRCPAKMLTPSPPLSPPRSWSRSSSSRQAMEPMAPSPPMKSTETRFRWWVRSTRGREANGVEDGSGSEQGSDPGLSPVHRSGRPAK